VKNERSLWLQIARPRNHGFEKGTRLNGMIRGAITAIQRAPARLVAALERITPVSRVPLFEAVILGVETDLEP